MFSYLLTTRLKLLVRQKHLIFWTLIFPIFLGFLFYLGLTKTYQVDMAEDYSIGIVSEEKEIAHDFTTTLSEATTNKFTYDFQFLSKEKAEEKLQAGKIVGYFEVQNPQAIQLVIKDNGMIQRRLKLERDQYLQQSRPVESSSIVSFSPQRKTKGEINYRNYYFFTLIGMAIGYGMVWGIYLISDLNRKGLQSRLMASPLAISESMLARITAAFILLLAEILSLILLFKVVFQVDFTGSLIKLLLLCIAAVTTSLSLGALLGTLLRRFKTEAAIFLGVSFSTTMGCLAGMFNSMAAKHWIDQHLIILAKTNFVNLVSEGLFYLNYSLSSASFYQNIFYLFGLTIVFSLSTYFCQKKVMI